MRPVWPLLSAEPPEGTDLGQGGQPAGSGLFGRLLILTLIVLASLLLVAGLLGLWRLTRLFQEDDAMTRWVDGSRHGRWLAVFDGYGRTTAGNVDGEQVISLAPKPALAPGTTHASLVIGADHDTDVRVTAQLRTLRQLRAPGPHPWEVGWLLWHYADTGHFYAFTLKTNGWELTKQDPAYPGGQRFLASGEMPHATVATWYAIEIIQVGGAITVAVDGVPTADLTDSERPYLAGAAGLYCEDSEVEFRRVTVSTAPPAPRPRS